MPGDLDTSAVLRLELSAEDVLLAGNQFEIVTATCDVVTMIHKQYRQDPTAAPGTFYEAFTFDAFRVRNGKVVEHWDGALIQPPAPPGGQRGQ